MSHAMSDLRGRGHATGSARTSFRNHVASGSGDRGMSTAEYAVGTVAACGFAALLFKILTSHQVRELVTGLITHALRLAG